jgi:hypothetical protein
VRSGGARRPRRGIAIFGLGLGGGRAREEIVLVVEECGLGVLGVREDGAGELGAVEHGDVGALAIGWLEVGGVAEQGHAR